MSKPASPSSGDIIVDDATIERYKRIYSIEKLSITSNMVKAHWDLERQLTKTLLESSPETRKQVWESCYTRLYRELPWLNKTSPRNQQRERMIYGHFNRLLRPHSRVLEIGSGNGALAEFLSSSGHTCVATEITSERGKISRSQDNNLQWHLTDGVHLREFEPDYSYDAIVSNQVVEHLHPTDLQDHLAGAFAILRKGGRYLLVTPHRFFGPTDLSRVFRKREAMCMHLREYLSCELVDAANRVGFVDVRAVYLAPRAIRHYLPIIITSHGYLFYLRMIERLIVNLAEKCHVKVPVALLRAMLFTSDIFLVLTKPAR